MSGPSTEARFQSENLDGDVESVHTLDDLIRALRHLFDEDHVDTDRVQKVMATYRSVPVDWKRYAHFDRHRYTRNLVDTGNGKYNLMLLAWSEGQGSSIHDHSGSHCFMKVLAGTVMESQFEWPNMKPTLNGDVSSDGSGPESPVEDDEEENYDNQEMTVVAENVLKTNEVTYIHDNIGLHRVENPSHTLPAVTLHLYCPPFESCRSFDQRTGHAQQVKVTFYSQGGSRTPFKGLNPSPAK